VIVGIVLVLLVIGGVVGLKFYRLKKQQAETSGQFVINNELEDI